MPARPTHPDIVLGTSRADAATRSDADRLRIFVIAAGICWSVLFVVVGLRYELQMYGDGAMFSYSVAVQDAWAFHWHNISGRLTVYLFSLLPAEAYVGLTGDPGGGHHRLWLFVLRGAAPRADRDLCGRSLQGPHHFRLRMFLDRLPLPVGLRFPDRNVDGARFVLADARRRSLRPPDHRRDCIAVRTAAHAHI